MKRFTFFIVSFALFIFGPFPLYGEEKELTLEEVVVTATRDIQEIRKIPANVSVITKGVIEQSNAQTTVDLLRYEAGLVVRDFSGTGKSASMDIRGFGETAPQNSLVLVDGRRVNEIDLSGVDWTQIPLEQIERIEIIRGAGSVLYGDNAVGGVVNIITKRPDKPFFARAEMVGGSYHYNKESASVGGQWGPFSAVLQAGYNATEGYRDNGFLRAKDAGGRIIYDVTDRVSLNLSGSFHKDDAGLPGAIPRAIYETDRRAARNPDDKVQTDDGYGAVGLKAKLWNSGRFEADLSYRNREVKDFFRSSSFEDDRRLETWGFTPRYILEKTLWNHSNKVTLGVDLYRSDSDIDSVAFGVPNRSEVTKKSVGLYLLDEFSILENLILSLGSRYEGVTFDLFQRDPFLKDKVRDWEPAWNAGLDYLFGKRTSAFFSVKRSFRFPVTDELVQFIFFPDFLARINPDMKPQTGYHYETGIRHAFSDRIEANLTFFWIDLDDEIFLNPETFTNENISKTRRQGVEAGGRVKPFDWLSVWGNYAYTRARIRGVPFPGNEIPMVARHKGALGIDSELGKGFLFNAKLNLVGSRRFISDFQNQVDRLGSYYTLDMKLAYYWKSLKAFAGVNNITNQKYAELGVLDFLGRPNYYSSPERNYFAGVSYSF